eukprot:CAMPEP_0202696246 /NCGR_PEP_ID=MMETSP1385-20130828/9539_1 /ASSEMBLY_ACC=CAM_ASM_000861 /TAXON_ID=933848 /ORGANISM="Elphidium margaritaceum" /LENGTH=49 /DNA_ID= /DNA_START= /DNA_END= /DNA_ORIENTATION=
MPDIIGAEQWAMLNDIVDGDDGCVPSNNRVAFTNIILGSTLAKNLEYSI